MARAPDRSVSQVAFDLALTVAILGILTLLALRLDYSEVRHVGTAVVNDGDTLTLGGQRIRLLGIDAPEYHQTCRRDGADYACGQQARSALVRLIGAAQVECSGSKRDRYRRLLAICTAGATDLNRSLVKQGWAVAYGDYRTEEREAETARAGLWAGSFERPRDWRSEHGEMADLDVVTVGTIADWLRRLLRLE